MTNDSAAPLRRDVRMLGTILGTVLVEQEGPWLLELVEQIRRDARSARRDGAVVAVDPALGAREQALVLRAFGLYFQLANLAEQHHRLRRRREDAHDGRVSRESLEGAFQQLGDHLDDRAHGTEIRLVLTAHPTEATRRTVLLGHIRVSEQLRLLDDPRISPVEQVEAEERIAEEVTLLWQTDEVRHDRLRHLGRDPARPLVLRASLMSAATDLLKEWRDKLPDSPPPIAFGSWIGGDMDGNPAAGPASIREALERAQRVALDRYRTEVRALAVELASARSLVAISPELAASLARDEAELPYYAEEIGARNELEPYRRKLSFMWWRLGTNGYTSAAELLADLRVIRASLTAHGGKRVADGRVARLERMVEIFGFPRREARHSFARARSGDEPGERGCPGRAGRAPPARPGVARHADHLRDVLGGRRASCTRDERRVVGRAAVRDGGRPDGGAEDPRRAA